MDTSFLIGLIGAILGAASMLLHVIAPRTKTPVDDEWRDDIDEVLRFIRGPGAAATAPKPPGAGAGGAMMLLLLVAGVGGFIQPSCAAGAKVSAIEAGVVTCARGDIPAAKALGLQLGTEALGQLLLAGAVDWPALEAEAEAAAKAQGLAVASCAFGDLVAELDRALHPTPASSAPSARVAVVEPLAGAHAALAAFERAHGITRIDP